MRLNKYLSEKGLCSRREADDWIAARRVSINGVIAELGTPVTDHDEVYVDGRLVSTRQKPHITIAFNKPIGVTCTTEARVRDNIIDFIGHEQRIFPIGRLDKDSEGLILLTSDGDIVNALLRAEHGHEKEYLVEIDRPVTKGFLDNLQRGVNILGTRTLPCRAWSVGPNSFRIVLTQGLNRQIRRMCEHFGYEVVALQRTRFVNIELQGLQLGYWRDLTAAEMATLLS